MLEQEQLYKPAWGKYRGIVSNNNDPDQRGRIRAYVPKVLGDIEVGWCEPANNINANSLFIPKIGDNVWIEFQGGNVNLPIYTGAYFNSGGIPSEGLSNYPNSNVLKASDNVSISMDDSDDSISIDAKSEVSLTSELEVTEETENFSFSLDETSGRAVMKNKTITSEVAIDLAGNITATTPGNAITLTSGSSTLVLSPTIFSVTVSGNTITLDSTGFKVNGTPVP